MIRVIYRWRIQLDSAEKFIAAWDRATTAIRQSTKGARGSVLLQSHDDSTMFVTIARWDTVEEWQKFWNGVSTTEMQDMHAIAEQLSVDVFAEIEDHTV